MFNKKVINGSLILLIAFGIFNLLNFLYQFAMARMLSISDYGILATLFAITYIFSVFAESIQTIVAKYTVEAKNNGQVRGLLNKSLNKGSILATKIFIVYLIICLGLAYFFKISYLLLALNGIILYFMFLLPVSRGAMQGKKRFVALGSNLIIESAMKLILGAGFVFVGWKIYGAIGGFTLGALIAFLMSFIPLKNIYEAKEEKFTNDSFYSYAKPTFFITAIIVLFYSIDVIIVKILFDPVTAGAYAIASILGKVILWVTVPIGKAMFPLSAESRNDSQSNKKILSTTIVIMILIIVSILTLFYFLPDLIVRLFSGESIIEASRVLFYLGIAFGMISLANMIFIYQLSIGKIKKYRILILCNILEVLILISSYQSIERFSISFALSSFILLIASILFARINRHL